jgi:hypothetical protein
MRGDKRYRTTCTDMEKQANTTMTLVSCYQCSEPASYESETCRTCGYLFLEPSARSSHGADATDLKVFMEFTLLRIVGVSVFLEGMLAAVADAPILAGSLLFFGFGTILADILSAS